MVWGWTSTNRRVSVEPDHFFKKGMSSLSSPGLYYPGLGAVRIEDMVLVTKDGCRNLTNFPKVFELG